MSVDAKLLNKAGTPIDLYNQLSAEGECQKISFTSKGYEILA